LSHAVYVHGFSVSEVHLSRGFDLLVEDDTPLPLHHADRFPIVRSVCDRFQLHADSALGRCLPNASPGRKLPRDHLIHGSPPLQAGLPPLSMRKNDSANRPQKIKDQPLRRNARFRSFDPSKARHLPVTEQAAPPMTSPPLKFNSKGLRHAALTCLDQCRLASRSAETSRSACLLSAAETTSSVTRPSLLPIDPNPPKSIQDIRSTVRNFLLPKKISVSIHASSTPTGTGDSAVSDRSRRLTESVPLDRSHTEHDLDTPPHRLRSAPKSFPSTPRRNRSVLRERNTFAKEWKPSIRRHSPYDAQPKLLASAPFRRRPSSHIP